MKEVDVELDYGGRTKVFTVFIVILRVRSYEGRSNIICKFFTKF